MTNPHNPRTTRHDIRLKFRDMHDLFIPAGAKARWVNGGQGGWAVLPFTESVQLESKTRALFAHDATYYYIWIKEEDLA